MGLMSIDHIVGNVEVEKMEYWVDYYKSLRLLWRISVLGQRRHQHPVLRSGIEGDGKQKRHDQDAYQRASEGLRESLQIQEYLDYYTAGGVQHIAITTRDIIKTVGELHKRGVEFLTVPQSYYDSLTERVGEIDEDIEELAKFRYSCRQRVRWLYLLPDLHQAGRRQTDPLLRNHSAQRRQRLEKAISRLSSSLSREQAGSRQSLI